MRRGMLWDLNGETVDVGTALVKGVVMRKYTDYNITVFK